MVSMPGSAQEKFFFTVWDDRVAADINAAMGRRVSLHYEEKVGLPTRCFGETRHWVTKVTVVPEIPLAPGVMVPVPPAAAPGSAPGASAPQSEQPASAARPPGQPGQPPAAAPATR
jgi:hypothetical protein